MGKALFTDGALSALRDDLPLEEFPHLTGGSEFPVSSGMVRIFNASNAHLALPFLSWDFLPTAAEQRAVNRAQLISTESHGFLQLGFGGN